MFLPKDKGFGTALRSRLINTRRGVFYGSVRDPEGIEAITTLKNYDYLFYGGNFMPIFIED